MTKELSVSLNMVLYCGTHADLQLLVLQPSAGRQCFAFGLWTRKGRFSVLYDAVSLTYEGLTCTLQTF